MKNDGWYWIAGAAIGLALSVGSCRQKEATETPQSSVTLAPTNPAPEKSNADDPSTAANAGSNAETPKAPQEQKPDDAKKSSKG